MAPMTATGGAPGADTETVSLCLELLTKYIELDQPPDAAFHQPKRHGMKKVGDAAFYKDRTTLSELGRMCVWLQCYTIAKQSGKTCRLPWGARDKIAKKYNISASTVKSIWAGRLGTRGGAGSDDATKQLRDHFRQRGQGGAGTLQDADDESVEEVDEEAEEEETMAVT